MAGSIAAATALPACSDDPGTGTPTSGPSTTGEVADPSSSDPGGKPVGTGSTLPARPVPSGMRLALAMPLELVEQRREWWFGEQVAAAQAGDGSLLVFFTTLVDPNTDETRLSFTRFDPIADAWSPPVDLLRGPQVRPLHGSSVTVATEPDTGRIAIAWERQSGSAAATGAELAWTDDAGANWETHLIDRPAALPRLLLRDERILIGFRDLTGMVVGESATPSASDTWTFTSIPENGGRLPTSMGPVFRLDPSGTPALTYQTIAPDSTTWLTTWTADQAPGQANPIDLPADSDASNSLLQSVPSGPAFANRLFLSRNEPEKPCAVALLERRPGTEDLRPLCPFGDRPMTAGPSSFVAAVLGSETARTTPGSTMPDSGPDAADDPTSPADPDGSTGPTGSTATTRSVPSTETTLAPDDPGLEPSEPEPLVLFVAAVFTTDRRPGDTQRPLPPGLYVWRGRPSDLP